MLGTACGVGVEGTGWVARTDLVVTAAHVVAGQKDTVVELQSGARLPADVVAFDPRNDIAVLRVGGLGLRPLPLADAEPGRPVAVLGYPENGPFVATPARIGRTSVVLADDAYGSGPVTRARGGRDRRGRGYCLCRSAPNGRRLRRTCRDRARGASLGTRTGVERRLRALDGQRSSPARERCLGTLLEKPPHELRGIVAADATGDDRKPIRRR